MTLSDPFRQAANSGRQLASAYLRELGAGPQGMLTDKHAAEMLGAINGIVNDCEKLAKLIDALEFNSAAAYAALQKVMKQ